MKKFAIVIIIFALISAVAYGYASYLMAHSGDITAQACEHHCLEIMQVYGDSFEVVLVSVVLALAVVVALRGVEIVTFSHPLFTHRHSLVDSGIYVGSVMLRE